MIWFVVAILLLQLLLIGGVITVENKIDRLLREWGIKHD